MDLFGFHKSDNEVNQASLAMIPGLTLLPDFVSSSEEQSLLQSIDEAQWLHDLQRRVQHYGYKYDYKARSINHSMHIGPLPSWSEIITQRMIDQDLINFTPDQLIINEYIPGQGIAAHTDCEPCFGDTIISLSLGGTCVMNFTTKNDTKESVPILLENRCLVIMRKESRYNWTHGIAARKSDVFNDNKFLRKRRVSMTWRKVSLASV